MLGQAYDALLRVRAANEECYARLHVAASCWRKAGRAPQPPHFTPVRFSPDLARKLRQMPFAEPVHIRGDISGRAKDLVHADIGPSDDWPEE